MRAQSAAPSRPPRQPSANRPRTTRAAAATAAGSTAASETQLRRRLAEVEMRLRDLDDDAKRMQAHHDQELVSLERDNRQLRERIEGLRMEECMTPAEAQAVRAHLSLAQGPSGQHGESKLLGATSAKYQSAKAAVEAKRKECAAAERQLAEVRQQLTALRQKRQLLKQQTFSTKASAGVKMAAAQRYRVQVREQLQGLEEQVAREQERFSNMVIDAKKTRAAIDALLVNQTGNEKMYHKRFDALLDKRKEMAYLMEVCNSLCEERQQVNAELQDMKAYLAAENKQYEEAFQELSGVSQENATVQAANKEKINELRRSIAQTRSEREALEAENSKAKAALERRKPSSVGRRLNSEQREDSGSEQDFIHRAPDDAAATSSAKEGDGSAAGSEDGGDAAAQSGGHAGQIEEFEAYFQKLADIVQSDAIEDVVGFLDVAADERYRCFDEMNAIQRDIEALQAERAALRSALAHGGTSVTTAAGDSQRVAADGDGSGVASPPSALAALAEVTSVAALAAAAKSPRSLSPGQRGTSPSETPTSAAAAAQRAERMRRLQADLDDAREALLAEESRHEECSGVLSQVIAQVNEVFRGLGCSVAELRSVTGLEGVQQSTLLPCLSIVEQRVEEFLIAYSRSQHQRDAKDVQLWGGSQQQHQQPPSGALSGPVSSSSHNVARTVLRRPDLLPKQKGQRTVQVPPQQLPRSNDVAVSMPGSAVEAGHHGSLEDLVEERPLSEAELREVVEAKRAMMRQ